MLHLAHEGLLSAKPPFPLMHVDTAGSSRTCTSCATQTAKKLGWT
jgi:hypothetical protein